MTPYENASIACLWGNGLNHYGLFILPGPDSDRYSDLDSCTMQKFHIGSDPDSDPLIEMYGIGMDICPRDRYLSLKWVQ